jgi:hypothetical protein
MPVNLNIKMNQEERNYLHLVALASYFRTKIVEANTGNRVSLKKASDT